MASLEQVIDIKTTSFEDIIGHLKTYEERVVEKEEETTQDNQKLMYAPTDSQPPSPSRDSYGYSRGRGCGGRYYNIGRGRGRYYDRYYGDIYLSKISSYRGDKNGHYASSCPDRLLKLQETSENKEKEDTHEAEEHAR